MKKLICIILGLFLFTCSYGQAIINRSGPANTVQDARWMSQYNAFLPRYNDTTAANLQKGIDSCGAIIFTYDIAALWFRSCNNGSKQWVQILPAGSPTPGGQAWVNPINVNLFTDASLNASIGTFGANGMYWKTNNTTRLYLDRNGIAPETGNSVGIGIDPADSNRITYFSGGGGATPTWQQTLTAGSTLNTDNTIAGGGFDFTWNNVDNYFINTVGSFGATSQVGNEATSISNSAGSIVLQADASTGNSNFRIYHDSIKIEPLVGLFYIDTLTNLSTQNELLGRRNSTGQVGYITIGSGLSLSSGVLSSTVTGLAIGNTVTSATAGSIFFAGTGGTLQQKNSTLFFDSTNIELGLGTNSPASLFNAIAGVCDFRFSKGLSDVTPAMTVINTSGMAGGLLAGTSGAAFVYDNAGPFYLISENHSAFVNNQLGGGSVRMTLTATGELGINTTSPGEKLEVDGNAKVTGKFIGRNVIYRTLNASDADFTAAVGTAYVLPDPSATRTITLPTGQDADFIVFYTPQALSNDFNLSVSAKLPDNSSLAKITPSPSTIELRWDNANSVWRATVHQ